MVDEITKRRLVKELSGAFVNMYKLGAVATMSNLTSAVSGLPDKYLTLDELVEMGKRLPDAISEDLDSMRAGLEREILEAFDRQEG